MHTLHLISHTHWDREWHQTFQQFRLRLVHLIDGLLDLLDADSAYRHYMLDGQTIVLDDYLQIRTGREADLRRYVREGRILIGPWYILPDEFLVSPEALVRNLLEGDAIARRFGPKMMVGYIPDPFGHIGQMPQILHGFGIRTACLWRGVDEAPNEFWWQAPDGSRVLMGYLRQGYGNAAGILGNGPQSFVAAARDLRDQLALHTDGAHLLLMHGTDHQEAQPGTSAAVAFAAGKLDGDVLIHSTLPDYFVGIQASLNLDRLPVVYGELRSSRHAPMLPGVLSARMWIKQRNRACETLLEKWAEPFSTWAIPYGPATESIRQPQDVLREAWRLLMQCHPHDSICGCSIDQVHDEMRPRFDQVEQMGEEITRQSLAVLAEAVTTQPAAPHGHTPASSAVVVFNPTSCQRTDTVSTVVDAPSESGEFDLLDGSGTPISFQVLGQGRGELFNVTMDRKELQSTVSMIAAGSDVAGVRLLAMRLQREGDEVSIEVQAGQTGQPDPEEWERARKEIMALLEDPAIHTYHVRVHSTGSSQVLFTARDVPGFGYRTYWVRYKHGVQKEPLRLSPLVRSLMPLGARLAANPTARAFMQRLAPDPTARPPYRIDNEFFAVTAQPDGTLDVLDKRSGVLYHGQNRFVDGGDRGDEYNYSPPEVDHMPPLHLRSVHVKRGEVQHMLELTLEMETPEGLEADHKSRSRKTVPLTLSSRVTLIAGVERVDIHTELDNLARDHRLRVHFAAPFAVSEADYDGHFEVIRRPLGVPAFDASWAEQPRPEVPQRAFCAVSDGTRGLLIANRGLPEVEVTQRDGHAEIALTLLRCVGWLSRDDFPERRGPAGPVMPTPGAQMPGHWAFDYAIIPFAEVDRLTAYHQAYAFQAPLRAASTALHEGMLSSQDALLHVSPQDFIISAIKTARDGSGWLVRGYNISDQPLTVALRTLIPFISAERANLAEEQLTTLSPGVGHEISFDVKAHEVATVLFTTPMTEATPRTSS